MHVVCVYKVIKLRSVSYCKHVVVVVFFLTARDLSLSYKVRRDSDSEVN